MANDIEPCTPKKTDEPSPDSGTAPRRSARLSGRSVPDSGGDRVPSRKGKEVAAEPVESPTKGKRKKPNEEEGDNGGGAGGRARYSREEKQKGQAAPESDKKVSDRIKYLWPLEDRLREQNKSRESKIEEPGSKEGPESKSDSGEGDDDGNISEGESSSSVSEASLDEILDQEALLQEINERQEQEARQREEARQRQEARHRAQAFNHVAQFARGYGEEANRHQEVAIEDWPGPFSTAMKIIRDREKRARLSNAVSNPTGKADLEWAPKTSEERSQSRLSPPSLLDISMMALLDNVACLNTLNDVPDPLRTRMSKLLSDSRRLDASFFRLLLQGSPTEVCVSDCSWLTEEDLAKALKDFDPKNLKVLQLDLCGRCLPDYILLATLDRFSKTFPVLRIVSLRGACRLSDAGLRSLVSSAPSLASINLSQCSILTHSSIEAIAGSLGSVLKKLFLDDCQGIDAMLMIPALKKLERLETFSVARIESVGNEFIKEFVGACGHNIKELILTDCVKLNDSSVEAIAGKCPCLLTIDLSKCNLTDYALAHLANGCQLIQVLRFRRNSFSDEGVAAFIESSGQSLEELSLNRVKKVGCQTAVSIVKTLKKLQSLDLSWCRDLTDNALGLIADNCPSLRVLRLFGCTQISGIFLNGHSNLDLKIIGVGATPLLQDFWKPNR